MKIPQVQKIRILPNAMPIPGGSVSVSRRELPIPQISPQRKKSQCTKPKTSEPGALKHKTFEVGQNSLAIYLPDNSDEDKKFAQLCHNYTVQINPCQMGFIPHKYFLNQYYSFGSIVGDYFQKKNNPNCRFLHKLYNAIKLGEMYPEYLPYVGVSWISNEVLQVSKYRFARLLGIKTVDGSLFHRQGNFRSFGFVELTSEEIIQEFGVQKLESLDLEVEKLLKHEEGIL